jgi:hypothetical protein
MKDALVCRLNVTIGSDAICATASCRLRDSRLALDGSGRDSGSIRRP